MNIFTFDMAAKSEILIQIQSYNYTNKTLG